MLRVLGLVVLVVLAGCGISSAAMRIADVPFGENVTTSQPYALDDAPASHAIVRWRDDAIRCGRVAPSRVTHETYTFTPVVKVLMGFIGSGEAFGGTMLLVGKGGGTSATVAGSVMLADGVLALAEAVLFHRRRIVARSEDYGLAYHCKPGDGIAIGTRVAPVTETGELSAADRAALRAELAAGGAFRIVVDGKAVAVPPDPEERCTAVGDPACANATASPVLVTLTRVPSVVRLPMLPPPPPPSPAGGHR